MASEAAGAAFASVMFTFNRLARFLGASEVAPGDVNASCRKTEVSKFYRRLSLLTHPDKTTDPERRKLFIVLGNAYEAFCAGRVGEDPATAGPDPGVEPEFSECDSDLHSSPDQQDDSGSRHVDFTTFAHSSLPGRTKQPKQYSRQSIAAVFLSVYKSRGIIVRYMSVFLEHHENGEIHYHIIVNCMEKHRFIGVAADLRSKGIYCHFSTKASGYAMAFRYCYCPTLHKPWADLDKKPLFINCTEEHPPPHIASKPPFWFQRTRTKFADDSPKRSRSTSAAPSDSVPTDAPAAKKSVRVRVFEYVLQNRIQTADELKLAGREERTYRPWLLDFVLKQTTDGMQGFVDSVWDVEEAESRVRRAGMSHWQMFESYSGDCICDGKWIPAADYIMDLQGIDRVKFCTAIKQALVLGCCREGNFLVIGPTASGKSWVLRPLRRIFKAFVNPAPESNHPLQCIEAYEICSLMDFRFGDSKLKWSECLHFFEGEDEMTIARPKPQAGSDKQLVIKHPMFVSCPFPIRHPQRDADEEEQMAERFINGTFVFKKSIPRARRKAKLIACGYCFQKWVLQHSAPPAPAPAPASLPPRPDGSGGAPTDVSSCVCGETLRLTWRKCPACTLANPFFGCAICKHLLQTHWVNCPECGSAIPQPAAR